MRDLITFLATIKYLCTLKTKTFRIKKMIKMTQIWKVTVAWLLVANKSCILKQYGDFPQVIAAWHHIPKPYWFFFIFFCGLGFWLPFLKCLQLALLLANCLLRFPFCSRWKTLLDGMVVITTALLMDTMTIAWMGLETLIVVPLEVTEVSAAASVEIGVVVPSPNPCITQVRISIPMV